MQEEENSVSLESTQIEKSFTCPYCWENISIVLDLTTGSQEFIEDCEVCCHPIRFQCQIQEGQLEEFTVEKS